MEYSKEFKEALSNFTPKEKDKLIFRLLKKDKILSQKLYFELIETKTVDEKRQEIEDLLLEKISYFSKNITNPKYFLVLIRKLSGEITLHVKVTSDKFGEVYLNLFLVKSILILYKKKFSYQSFEQTYKLYLYLINKIFRSLILTLKLDEDYFMEIDEILKDILNEILDNQKMQNLCINNDLNFSYFKTEKIPKNIAEIVKDLKLQGFLK
ncbi:deoxyuridine 5'-triphosphate nucleotidohydrolase [Halpernia sp.]|uniref:deoxyuridine 5'-triphosphate nucleotidohydrolase n=1 Tax=Halpernia sp. TaxID=2782209 RepID=UPI003A8F2381